MQCREYNYIDKTKCLQEGIDRFPSVYIEGNAASGKTAAVRMFLAKYPEVIIRMFDFSVELKQSKKLLTEIQSLQKQMKEQCVWVVCENIPGRLDPEVAQAMVQMVQESQKNTRVFFISREKPQAEFLKLLWNDKMDLISMDRLLLSKEEVHVLAERIQSKCDVDRIYEKTGGWAGCVNMLLRLSKNKDDSIEELLRSYEMKNYIQQEIFSALSEREKDLLEYVAGCPWVNADFCREVWGVSEADELLENLKRKGFLVMEKKKERFEVLPMFLNYLDVSTLTKGKEAVWYERQGCIEETLFCQKRSNEEKAYEEW